MTDAEIKALLRRADKLTMEEWPAANETTVAVVAILIKLMDIYEGEGR